MKVFIGNMSPIRVETKPLLKFEPVKPQAAIIVPHVVETEIVDPIRIDPLPVVVKKEQVPAKEDRKVRSVSFNLTDAVEVRMNKFSNKQPSFSTYVKKLIQRDMEASK